MCIGFYFGNKENQSYVVQ